MACPDKFGLTFEPTKTKGRLELDWHNRPHAGS